MPLALNDNLTRATDHLDFLNWLSVWKSYGMFMCQICYLSENNNRRGLEAGFKPVLQKCL
jgi:hypothetical protein